MASSTSGATVSRIAPYSSSSPVRACCIRWLSPATDMVFAWGTSAAMRARLLSAFTCRSFVPFMASSGQRTLAGHCVGSRATKPSNHAERAVPFFFMDSTTICGTLPYCPSAISESMSTGCPAAIKSKTRLISASDCARASSRMLYLSSESSFCHSNSSFAGTAMPASDTTKSAAPSDASMKAMVPPSEWPTTPTRSMPGMPRHASMAARASSRKV